MTSLGACRRACRILLVVPVIVATRPAIASAAPISADSSERRPSALDRVVSFHAPSLSLRDALDGLAAAAHVRLSYSPETLPLDRWVSVSFDSVTVGVALARLLAGMAVEPVLAGPDHIVLAPSTAHGRMAPEAAPLALDRVVVTGSAAGDAARPLSVAVNVLDGRDLAQQGTGAGALSQALAVGVPGMWMWEQSPLSLFADYGSIRGASSLGVSYPKVYIDGIEVANPLVVTHLAPEAIDRIEVIRGPQGAALYGADAISGVTNIVLRHTPAGAGAVRTRVEAATGLAATDYAASPALRTDYTLAMLAGSNTFSAGLNADLGTTGAYIPGASARDFAASGTARLVETRSILTGTARVFQATSARTVSPILTRSVPSESLPSVSVGPNGRGQQSVLEYTAGATLKLLPNDRWQHTVIAGLDGYSLDGVVDQSTPVVSASTASATSGSAVRGTLRASSVTRMALGAGATATVTLGAEQSLLSQDVTAVGGGGRGGQLWRSNTALVAQTTTSLHDRLFVTMGARLENDAGASAGNRFATLPMLGVAWVPAQGPVTLKMRMAYGKGIRWPEATPSSHSRRDTAATSRWAIACSRYRPAP